MREVVKGTPILFETTCAKIVFMVSKSIGAPWVLWSYFRVSKVQAAITAKAYEGIVCINFSKL